MIALFATNPFHVLGVRANTDLRTLRRLLEERSVQVQLGMHPQGLTEEVIRSFRQTIETPDRRVRAELFGLHAIDPGLPSEQLPLLRERAQGANGLDLALLYHDVAVTAHLLWALSHADSAEGVESLRISLDAWRPLLRDKTFWDYLAARSEGSMSADALWQASVRAVAGSVTATAGEFLDRGQLGAALALITVLRESALPGATIDEAMHEMTRDTRAELGAAVQDIVARGDDTVEGAVAAETALINGVLGPCRRLGLLGVRAAETDAMAAAIRAVCVRVHNVARDPFVAVALLDAGLAVVTAPRLVSGFATDRAIALRLHHQERATAAWQASQWAAAAAHATLAADFSDRAEAQELRDLAARATARSSPAEVAESIRVAAAPFEAERAATNRRIDAAAHFQLWNSADRMYTNPTAVGFASRPTPPPAAPALTQARAADTNRGRWLFFGVFGAVLLWVWASNSAAQSPGVQPSATSGSRSGQTAVPQTSLPTVLTTPGRLTQAPLVGPRAVLLQPQQIIMPPAELPFGGYSVSSDAACGSGCWGRTFTAANSSATGNYFFSVVLDVLDASTTGASLVARQDCTLVDSQARPVISKEIIAQVIGDGAKACRHDVGTNAVAYTYYTADRNVLIRVRSNPSLFGITDAEAAADLVTVARQQIAIIERVAPR